MARPDVRITRVTLHISTDTDFPRKFGQQVKAAGGKYSEVRGGMADCRYVEIPWERRDLIDAIVTQFPKYKQTPVLVSVSGDYNGRHDTRVGRLFQSGQTVYYWKEELGIAPADFIERKLQGIVERSFDWPSITEKWDAEDRAEAERHRTHALRQRLEELKVRIAAESLRILDGANDIDGLKELAQELRDACAALGIEEPRSELEGAAGFRM